VILLDTHIWVWWVSDPGELSAKSRRLIEQARVEGTIHISSISIWEVALLVGKDRLRLRMDVRDWIAKSEALPFLNFVPVDNMIALKSAYLPGPLHNDPADRIIIATAVIKEAILVTKDEKIINYPHIRTVS
jgi:PIN domain nuclease of toxin-antitoxin system